MWRLTVVAVEENMPLRTSALGERKPRLGQHTQPRRDATRVRARRSTWESGSRASASDSTHNHAATQRRANAARAYPRVTYAPYMLARASIPQHGTWTRGARVPASNACALHARYMRLRSHADGARPR